MRFSLHIHALLLVCVIAFPFLTEAQSGFRKIYDIQATQSSHTAALSDGGVIMASTAFAPIGRLQTTIQLLKLDDEGHVRWAKDYMYGTTGLYAADLILADNGDYVVLSNRENRTYCQSKRPVCHAG